MAKISNQVFSDALRTSLNEQKNGRAPYEQPAQATFSDVLYNSLGWGQPGVEGPRVVPNASPYAPNQKLTTGSNSLSLIQTDNGIADRVQRAVTPKTDAAPQPVEKIPEESFMRNGDLRSKYGTYGNYLTDVVRDEWKAQNPDATEKTQSEAMSAAGWSVSEPQKIPVATDYTTGMLGGAVTATDRKLAQNEADIYAAAAERQSAAASEAARMYFQSMEDFQAYQRAEYDLTQLARRNEETLKPVQAATDQLSTLQDKINALDAPNYGAGNIDLSKTPRFDNGDGTYSTLDSMSFHDDKTGLEILIPTVVQIDGKWYHVDEETAIAQFRKTGQYLGAFNTVEDADAYAIQLHEQQEKLFDERSVLSAEYNTAKALADQLLGEYNDGANREYIAARDAFLQKYYPTTYYLERGQSYADIENVIKGLDAQLASTPAGTPEWNLLKRQRDQLYANRMQFASDDELKEWHPSVTSEKAQVFLTPGVMAAPNAGLRAPRSQNYDAAGTEIKRRDAIRVAEEAAGTAAAPYLNALADYKVSGTITDDAIKLFGLDWNRDAAEVPPNDASIIEAMRIATERAINKEGFTRQEAANVVNALIEAGNAIYQKKDAENLREITNENAATMAGMSAVSLLTNMASGVGAVEALRSVFSASTDQRMDPNSLWFSNLNTTNTIRGSVSGAVDWNYQGLDLFDETYSMLMSGLDSMLAATLPRLGTTGGITAGALLLSGNAAAQSLLESAQNGAPIGEAILSAGVAGTFEALFENISIEQLKAFQEGNVFTYGDILRNVGKAFATNFEEEGATTLANDIFDWLKNSPTSNFNASIGSLMTQINPVTGKVYTEKEARAKTWANIASEVMHDAITGGIQGVLMGSAAQISAIQKVHQINKFARTTGLERGDIANAVLAASYTGGESRRIGREFTDRLQSIIDSSEGNAERKTALVELFTEMRNDLDQLPDLLRKEAKEYAGTDLSDPFLRQYVENVRNLDESPIHVETELETKARTALGMLATENVSQEQINAATDLLLRVASGAKNLDFSKVDNRVLTGNAFRNAVREVTGHDIFDNNPAAAKRSLRVIADEIRNRTVTVNRTAQSVTPQTDLAQPGPSLVITGGDGTAAELTEAPTGTPAGENAPAGMPTREELTRDLVNRTMPGYTQPNVGPTEAPSEVGYGTEQTEDTGLVDAGYVQEVEPQTAPPQEREAPAKAEPLPSDTKVKVGDYDLTEDEFVADATKSSDITEEQAREVFRRLATGEATLDQIDSNVRQSIENSLAEMEADENVEVEAAAKEQGVSKAQYLTQEALNILLYDTGMRIEFKPNSEMKGLNGEVDLDNGVIYINANAPEVDTSRLAGIAWVIGHEITHSTDEALKAKNKAQLTDILLGYEKDGTFYPGVMQKLAESGAIEGAYAEMARDPEKLKAALDEIKKDYADYYVGKNMEEEEIDEKLTDEFIRGELAGDFFGTLLGINRYDEKQSKKLGTKFKRSDLLRTLAGIDDTPLRAAEMTLRQRLEAQRESGLRGKAFNQAYDTARSQMRALLNGVRDALANPVSIENAGTRESAAAKGTYERPFDIEEETWYNYSAEAQEAIHRIDKDEFLTTDEYLDIPEVQQAIIEGSGTPTIDLPNRKEIQDNAFNEMLKRGSYTRTVKDGKKSRDIFDGPIKRERRVDIVMGLPGSGKSSVFSNPLSKKYGSRIIDTDDFREFIPEYNGKNSNLVHKEASLIKERVLNEALGRGENLLLSIIGDDLEKLRGQIQRFADKEGYQVFLHLNELPNNKSMSRAIRRYLTDGRFVPVDMIEGFGKKPTENYLVLTGQKGASYDERGAQGLSQGAGQESGGTGTRGYGYDYRSAGQTGAGTTSDERQRLAGYDWFNNDVEKGAPAVRQDAYSTDTGLDFRRQSLARNPVTAEQNRAYLDAVRRGDTETAQRMVNEAAQNAGYNVNGWHGTTNFFTIFDPKKGNPEGDWGRGLYFTTNADDVAANYANNEGPDLQAKINNLAQKWFEYDTDEDEYTDYETLKALARSQLSEGNPRTISAALKIKNPVVMGDGNGFENTVLTAEELRDYIETVKDIAEDNVVFSSALDSLDEIYDFVNSDGSIEARDVAELVKNRLKDKVYDFEENRIGNDIAREAFARIGYDAIIDNMVGYKFAGMKGLDKNTAHIIVNKPTQVKVTDAVTYDDSGNPIPLSERYNPTNADYRYSVGGSTALKADMDALKRAMKMEAKGKDADYIFKYSGWWKDPADGKWKFEINDKPAKFVKNAEAGLLNNDLTGYWFRNLRDEYKRLKKEHREGKLEGEALKRYEEVKKLYLSAREDHRTEFWRNGGKIGDVIDHKLLFENYPGLKDVPFEFKDLGDHTGGQYMPGLNKIELNSRLLGDTPAAQAFRDSFKGDLAPGVEATENNIVLSILLHEMQHQIQAVEGFASGGNPSVARMAQNASEKALSYYDRVIYDLENGTGLKAKNAIDDFRNGRERAVINNQTGEVTADISAKSDSLEDLIAALNEWIDAERAAGNITDRMQERAKRNVRDYAQAMYDYDYAHKIGGFSYATPHRIYEALRGEQESNEVMRRQLMGAKERRENRFRLPDDFRLLSELNAIVGRYDHRGMRTDLTRQSIARNAEETNASAVPLTREEQVQDLVRRMMAAQNTPPQGRVAPAQARDAGPGAANFGFTQQAARDVEDWMRSGRTYNTLSDEQRNNTRDNRANRDAVQYPRTVDKSGRITSQAAQTIRNAGITSDSMAATLDQAAANGAFDFEKKTDTKAMTKARRDIERNGWDAEYVKYKDAVDKGLASKDITAMGLALYQAAATEGDNYAALDLALLMARDGNNVGAALQARRIMNQLGPDGQLYMAVRGIENIADHIRQLYPDKQIELDRKLLEAYRNALISGDQDAIDKAREDINLSIAEQLPADWREKLNNWRYMSMLTNPTTHVRNVLGNAGFAIPRMMKQAIKAGLERATMGKAGEGSNRTTAVLNPLSGEDRARFMAGWDDYKNVMDLIQNGGKQTGPRDEIEKLRTIYKNKAFEAVRAGNTNLLDLEDTWFSRPAYSEALASFLKARGIDGADYAAGNISDSLKAKAQDHAIREAQKATYRDHNQFSDLVADLGKKGKLPNATKAQKLASAAIEAVLPFKRTPANILARAVEYSPAELVQVVFSDIGKLHRAQAETRAAEAKNDGSEANIRAVNDAKTAEAEALSTMFDHIASSATGTGLLIIGAMLRHLGVLHGGADDDDEQAAFDKTRGVQEYSIDIGGKNYTIDWLAPEILPVFTGVALYDKLVNREARSENGIIGDLGDILLGMTEPMLNMSMLQSVNDLITTVKYLDEGEQLAGIAKNVGLNYLSQYVPTLGGKIESIVEPTRNTTYIDKSSPIGKDEQYFLAKLTNKSLGIPGVEYNQVKYYDVWGREQDNGNLLRRVVTNMLSPGYLQDDRSTPYDDELQRLHDAGVEHKVFPQRASQSTKVDDQYLTGAEYELYTKTQGETQFRLIGDLLGSSAYERMTDDERAEAISKVYSDAKKTAENAIRTERGETVKETAAQKANMDAAKYVIASSVYDNAETPKGYKTTPSGGTPKWAKMLAVLDNGSLSKDEQLKFVNAESGKNEAFKTWDEARAYYTKEKEKAKK